ncbi:unnamed protein product [Eretmochelys imbricata]
MTGFCRQWIPQYASLAKPLQELTRSSVPNPMPWPLEANAAFISLKQNLASAPALVKLSGIAARIHASQCKPAPPQGDQAPLQDHAEPASTPEDKEEQPAIPYNLRSRKGCQKQRVSRQQDPTNKEQ